MNRLVVGLAVAVVVLVAPVDEGHEYAVRLRFAAEGQIWDGTMYLRRAAHSMTLRDAEDREARVYVRC